MRTVKFILLATVLAIIVSVSMIIGIGLAHEDATMPTVNTVATNNLSVTVDRINQDGTVTGIDNDTILFDNDTVWTPGQAQVVYLLLTNKEEIEVNYSLGVKFTDGAAAKNAAGEDVKLSDLLHFGVVDGVGGFYDDSADAIADVDASKTLSSGFSRVGAVASNEGIVILALVVYLPESAGELTGGEIKLGLSLYVTSPLVKEEITPEVPNYFTGAVDAPAVDTNGATTESVTIGEDSKISAVLPEGVKLAEGATELSLTVSKVEESQANVTLGENETKVSLDVHIEGIATDNDVPMEIKLARAASKGLNSGSIKLYHVENGETIEMTQVALADEFTAHNQFKYDPATGDLILYMASFSEVAVVADTSNHWDGTVATGFNDDGTGTEEDPFIIANAEQLAFFRDVVDGRAAWDGNRSFKGQYVKLANDVILNHHGETANQFDPIGWGYAYTGYNRDGADGKVFMGTFDGNGHAIHGLWQNGWDLEAATEGADYTYTNCGFGLFASVQDATIKNLTIKHANVVAECVEMGIVVGLAQGNCTFENIMVYESHIANYQRPAGGVVGEVSPAYDAEGNALESQQNFINVHVGSSCTVGSLWGDFDTPCGGVIGAYWDDSGKTKVYMKDVDVSCVLDVYSDVTSAYQWYAYRRAGMLIGNTDCPPADGKNSQTATAPFLTCENCVVVYDYTWQNYAYCEFTNSNNPGKNYPWVRVQPSLYCSAYSNPRYGHPIDAAGNQVVDDLHVHDADDDCTVIIPFNQLYGGGQGVYGATEHTGVSLGKYTITFIGADGDIADVWYITDTPENATINSFEMTIPTVTNGDKTLLAWEDANGVKYATYDADNKTWSYNTTINTENLVDIVLYPEWSSEYNVYFLDHNDKVLYYEVFETGKAHTLNTDAVAAALATVQQQVDSTGTVVQATWDKDINNINFSTATDDIVVKIVLNVSSDSITLTPVYDANTGVLTNYKVTGVNQSAENTSISIPSYVGNIPVTEIDAGSFDGFNDLAAVRIPSTMTTLNDGIFPGSLGFISWFDNRQTVTIYYEGTKDQWNALVANASADWDDTLGDGSRIFFLEKTASGREIVDLDAGFIELFKSGSNYTWIEHNHPHLKTAPSTCTNNSHYKNFTDYDAAGRPDRNYWLDDNGNSIVNDDGSAVTSGS